MSAYAGIPTANRSSGYKYVFVLNSAEHEISTAN